MHNHIQKDHEQIMRMTAEAFVIQRDGEPEIQVQGSINRNKRSVRFLPEVKIKAGNWLRRVASEDRLYVTSVDPHLIEGRVIWQIAYYETEAQHNEVKVHHDKGDIVMGDKYEIGQAGAVGPGAHAHDMTFNQIWNQVGGDIDLPHLAEELVALRQEMKKEATEPEHDIAIGAIATAEQMAKTGDGPKTLATLKTAGKWALGVAEKIGVGLAVAAIKSSLGM